MSTINEVKQLPAADTPLLLFECTLASGDVERWCTHAITFNANLYQARVLKHNLFSLQLSADDAMDGLSQLSISLGNADSAMSQLERSIGFKGAQLTVYFVFADLQALTITTESMVLFCGVAGDPNEITEDTLVLTFTNKLSLQRIAVPEVRIQRNCPWNFPATLAQRTEALTGGACGTYDRYFRCGYSADVAGGVGNLTGGVAFTSCDGSRTQCAARGMFSSDSAGNATARFGGFEFVPSSILVRTSGDKTAHLSPVLDNSAKYNDPVPIVYGTGWIKSPVIFSRNDGNLTHVDTILSLGVISQIIKVVVNDVEIPRGVAGSDMTATGWYGPTATGTRNGTFNLGFTDGNGNPLGDPYGSMSALSVVVPNSISTGNSLPKVEVLLQGLQLNQYNLDGSFQSTSYTNNPAWVVLDILCRCGWMLKDINVSTFASAAQYCQTLIATTDANGNPISVPRYQCNLILTKRQSAAAVIRGVRTASSLMLRYGLNGLLELLPEATIAAQQPALPDGSNTTVQLNGGWPAYEFSDSSAPYSGIVRNPNGSSSVRLTSRTAAECSNRLSVEFQDDSNEYQQDSLSVTDADDSALIGYEVSSASTALGIANMNQATRVLLRQLDKSIDGNLFIQFETSFRALKVRPGDIIAVTYEKEGFVRTPFRVTKLSPSTNYQTVSILAQIHDDNWYSDNPAVLAGAGRQPGSNVQAPRPLIGLLSHTNANGAFEYFDFQVSEQIQAQPDGTATDTISVSFAVPAKPSSTSPAVPLLSLSPEFSATGGTIAGGQTIYYAVSAVDGQGNEGPLSFTVAASVPGVTNTNTVTISGLSFPSTASAFNVYCGGTPQLLYRVASNAALANSFTDPGLQPQPIGPADASFDHANFYYRYEEGGPWNATAASPNTIVCGDMGAVPLAYAGFNVRIIEGSGKGQERTITTNDASSLTVTPAWTTVPDVSSTFVVCEPSWHFVAVGQTSPVKFQISYRAGSVIQTTGRGANVGNVEGSPELCPITRVALGAGQIDAGTAAMPSFTLTAPGGGELLLSQVGFTDLTNTSSVTSGTLQVFYWNELNGAATYALAAGIDAGTSTVVLGAVASPYVGQLIQIDSELMTVLSVNSTANSYQVVRGVAGSQAASHLSGAPVAHLQSSTVVAPFALNFFSNRASLNFLHTVALPDVRISAAEFFVTNAFGDSEASQECFTTLPGGGLRTLSGGQFSLQISGTAATQQNACPPLLIEASHAVRDIRASISQAPAGYSIGITLLQNTVAYASLTISDGQTTSAVIDGSTLPPLVGGESLSANVLLTPTAGYQLPMSPGRDLTITVRL